MASKGDPEDLVQAYKWLTLSGRNGSNDKAFEYRDAIATGMALSQIDEARKLVREWLEKQP